MAALANRIAGIVVLLLAGLSVSSQAWALQVTLSEAGETQLGLRVSSTGSDADAALAGKLVQAAGAWPTNEAGSYVVALDSAAQIGRYMKAARLSAGVYVHLPALCPDGDCNGIRFTVQARHILFGGVMAEGSLDIEARDTRMASVFFTNEAQPRLSDGLYVGPEFSDAAVGRITESFRRIRAAYQALARRDLAAGTGAIATTARNDGNYTGFGGDSLNIIRMTVDNPKGVPESQLVDYFVGTYAHEVAHKLQTPRLHDLPQGRLAAEGSADFFKIVMLARSHAREPGDLSTLVMTAYDKCLSRRGAKGLMQRIVDRDADYREFYDCGMIDYFALMFSSGIKEQAFIAELAAVLGDKPGATKIARDCLVLGAACDDPVLADMMGDAQRLESRQAWFKTRLGDFLDATALRASEACQPGAARN